jgi:hypothetical protein
LLNFPNSPTNGQQFTGPGGVVWTWDGTKWTGASGSGGGGGGGIAEAPNDGNAYLRVSTAWASGGNLTGNLFANAFASPAVSSGASPSKDIVLYSGSNTATGGKSGNVAISVGGSANSDSGYMQLSTGNAAGNAGPINILSGNASVNGNSGALTFTSGDANGTGNSGIIQLKTGSVATGGAASLSGGVSLTTGPNNGTGVSGDISLTTGKAAGNAGGGINLLTGAGSTKSGSVGINSGDNTGSGTTGNITVGTGWSVNANSGALNLTTGNATGTADSGNVTLSSGGSSGSSGNSGYVFIATGVAVGAGKVSGSIYLQVGAVSGGASSGAINLTGNVAIGSGFACTLAIDPVTSMQAATKQYVDNKVSVTTPLMNGTAAVGTGTTYARADHVHASDTSRLPLTGGTLSGLLTVTSIAYSGNTAAAAAGTDGEFIEAVLAAGSAISLTTNTAATVTSISLTAGEWMVFGNYVFTCSLANGMTTAQGWVNTVPAAPTAPQQGFTKTVSAGQGTLTENSTGPRRILLTATTTITLGVLAVFASGTATAYGIISASRIR